MMKILTSKWITAPLYAAVKLKIPDIIDQGNYSITDIAEKIKIDEDMLYRIMRALASVGIFEELNNRHFKNNDLSKNLKSDALRPIALMFLSDWHNKIWDNFYYSLSSEKSAFELTFNKPAFHWFEENKKAADIFNQANSLKAKASYSALANHYDFSNVKQIIDIGGGYGELIRNILINYPNIKGKVADLPSVIQKAKINSKHSKSYKIIEFIACDFFKSIPAGNDIYIMANILHDWSDDKCRLILKNCFRSMGIGSKLLIIEMVIPEKPGPSIAKLMDLEVFVMGRGKERTEIEFEDLIKVEGIKITKIIPIGGEYHIIECTKY